MQEITRVRALCCECGNLRTVSANHRSRNDDNRSGECDDDARGWRVTGTLKCSVCGGKTRHALLRDDDTEFRDIAELGKHERQRAILGNVPAPTGWVSVDEWGDALSPGAFRLFYGPTRTVELVHGADIDVVVRGTQSADGSVEECSIEIHGGSDDTITADEARRFAAALIAAADEIDGTISG
jgi:hypothetical protein